MTGRRQPRGTPRGWALAATAGLVLTSALATTPAGADTFIDPGDRCLPGADAPPAPVSDRSAVDEVHLPSVDCVFAQGISLGTGSGTFGPDGMTRRDQMASFIVRTLEAAGYDVPAAGDQGFTDIAGNAHADSINRLAAIGVTVGRTPTTFVPQQLVRRDQMASFVVRAVEYAYGDDDFAVGEEPVPAFTDVGTSNVHRDNVDSGAQVLGLLAGQSDGTFRPDAPTQRQQMASFLVRVVDMTLVVE